MKTSVKLESPDRMIMGEIVPVLSDNGFVCITKAMDILSKKREKSGLEPRRLNDILNKPDFKETVIELANKLVERGARNINLSKIGNGHLSLFELNKMGMAKRRGKGKDQQWFIDPYVFINIAIEMDPETRADIILWITDGLIKFRNAAGDAYINMCKQISTIIENKSDFQECIKRVAKGINYIVFNYHEDGYRNNATSDQLDEIVLIENIISSNIDDGYIKDFNDLIKFLGNKWRKKWGNPIDSLV